MLTMMVNGTLQGLATAVLITLPWIASQRSPGSDEDESGILDPALVRAAAANAGLASLATVTIPEPAELGSFLRSGPAARQAAVALGKALFWDMQVGSDGQACASCHFHAGADNRSKNQIAPGLRNVDPSRRTIFDPTASGENGGPNYTLQEEDFPFHRLMDPEQQNYLERRVLFDTDDVVSSQGVFLTRFRFTIHGFPFDVGYPIRDGVFAVGNRNTRRVEPRNAPTVFNAVFNFTNFWDGRAHNVFNGVSVFGPLDEDAVIWVAQGRSLVPHEVRLENSSLASQAVGPPLSDLEMSYFDRTFRRVARKLLNNRPLAIQLVHPRDSVLGPYSRAFVFGGQLLGLPGLDASYEELIRTAFRPEYTATNRYIDGYSQMETNFTLFFGLSIQMYEATLVTDETPFDRFMEGDDEALSDEQLIGLLTFIRTPQSRHPPFTSEIGVGNCISCHGGPEFTDAAFTSLAREGLQLIELEEMPDLSGGSLAVGDETAFLDHGFSNIGVRPTEEDLGRGGTELGIPLSFARQALAGLSYAPDLPACDPRCPDLDRVAVDGAFKVPGLRNVELTGPYFHNGGQSTLKQVLEFYARQGDFGDLNLGHLDRNLALVAVYDTEDEERLIAFLLALTDHRVPLEKAPFDHPQLYIANGHKGNHEALTCDFLSRACDDIRTVPAVGEDGRPAAGLPPLEPFLGLDPTGD